MRGTLLAYLLEKGVGNLLRWFKTWLLELWTIPLAIVVFISSVPVLRFIDPTSATYDAGILQKILFAVIASLVFNGLAWAGIRMVWKELFVFFQTQFKTDFNNLSNIHKVWVGLFVFSLYFLSFVLLTLAV
ncbi:MAG: hypothetical protein V9G42_06005 [Bacteroidia bacterium]